MPQFGSVIPRLPVHNLVATISFYTDVLHFQVEVSWPEDSPTFAILRRGATAVGFFEPNEQQPGPPGYAELSIEVSGIGELHEELARQVPIEWGPEVYSYGRREFAVRDPDRYLLIFTEETSDPPTTHEPD